MYLRLAILGYYHGVHGENLQVAPADFLTYGYGSCTAKISGDVLQILLPTKTWCTVGMVCGSWWFDLKTMFMMFSVHLKRYILGGLKPPTRVDCDCLGYNMWWGRIRKNQSDKYLHAASILNVKAPMPLNTTCWDWLQVNPRWRTIIPNSWFIVVCVCASTWEYDIYYR